MNSDLKMSVASTIAGEDIANGDYVAILTQVVEVPSFLWGSCSETRSPEEMIRLKVIPGEAGEPFKVITSCLPFVYAKSPTGELKTFDLRRVQLVRLDSTSAAFLWKAAQSKAKKDARSSTVDK